MESTVHAFMEFWCCSPLYSYKLGLLALQAWGQETLNMFLFVRESIKLTTRFMCSLYETRVAALVTGAQHNKTAASSFIVQLSPDSCRNKDLYDSHLRSLDCQQPQTLGLWTWTQRRVQLISLYVSSSGQLRLQDPLGSTFSALENFFWKHQSTIPRSWSALGWTILTTAQSRMSLCPWSLSSSASSTQPSLSPMELSYCPKRQRSEWQCAEILRIS